MTTQFQTRCDDCGWTSTATKTQGIADHAFRIHSCERQRDRDASRARRLARAAAVDRTRQPCLHKNANHEHGTHACYVLDTCRCLPCAAATSSYERTRTRRHAYGQFDTFTDAQPVRDHVAQLTAAGISLKRIAKLTGISGGTFHKLVYGIGERPPSRRVLQRTAQLILSIPTNPPLELRAPGRRVDPIGSRRRIQALVRCGWSIERLALHGIDRQTLDRLDRETTVECTVATALAIRDLYDQLWEHTPPAGRGTTLARRRAERAGWPPPLAWDDDTIDNPDARPEPGERTPSTDQAAARLETREQVLELTERGLGADAIAERIGVTARTVVRIRSQVAGKAS